MSNTRVNTAFAKCFILFMAVVILLQGLTYLALSIWGITHRECSKQDFDLSSKPLQFAMNLIYFLDKNCGLPDTTERVDLDVDFNKAESIVTRAFIFFLSYAVISSLWIIASVSIIITLCGSITRTVKNLRFWPWFIIVMAGSILDVVATGFYIHDIMNTSSVEKTFKYLGISADNKTVEVLSSFEEYFIAPAVISTCISSRLILIWLLNVFGSSFCLSLSKTLSKMNSRKNTDTCGTNIQLESHQDVLPAQIQQYEENSRGAERSRPTLPSLTNQSFKEHPISSAQSDECFTNKQTFKVPSSNSNSATPPPNENKEYNDDDIIKNHSDGVNYPLPRNIFQYQQQLSVVSPLNNRYSTNNESFQYPMQNQKVSEELRSQLPWSYTSFPPPRISNSQTHVYPDIPDPDYGNF